MITLDPDAGTGVTGNRRSKLGGVLLIVLGLAIILAFGFDWSRYTNRVPAASLPAAPQVGARAPDFTLEDLDGRQISLSELKGKQVLVNFWATWCAPCRIEMPYFQARYEQYKGELVVLAIDFDEPAELVRSFAEEFGLTFDVLLDPGGVVQDQYEIRGYPTTYFVDHEGVIQAIHIGIMSENQLDGYLRQLGLH